MREVNRMSADRLIALVVGLLVVVILVLVILQLAR